MMQKIWVFLFLAFIIYSAFVYTKADSNPGAAPDAAIKAGWGLWQEKNCQSCHQLYGLGGYMGPDLTNVYSAPGKGPAYMKSFIQYGTGRMPDYQLTDMETAQLIRFLEWVDQSGNAAVPASAVHWTGTYRFND